MAWFNDYSRDYNRAEGYNRAGPNPRDRPGQRSTNYGYDAGSGSARGARGPAYGGERYGAGRYGGEYEYAQRHPEQSPLYGSNADQAVQRWANRYGYDHSYQIQPRNTGGQQGGGQQGGGQQGGGNMNRNQGGYGNMGGNRGQYQGGSSRGGGYGGTSGGYGGNEGYDQGYRY
ncbi:hypothetical protein BH23GEM3_BH23GEM3_07320 [soil metagenome]